MFIKLNFVSWNNIAAPAELARTFISFVASKIEI